MTAAEWMKTRFGDGPAGRLARSAYAVMAVLTLASFVGYAFQGIGKFAAVFFPLDTWGEGIRIPFLRDLMVNHKGAALAILIIGITTLYVLLGGLYSVVLTDVIQTVILTLASAVIAFIAWRAMTPDLLGKLPEDFSSLRIPWKIPEFAGTENGLFEFFGAMVIIWVVKGFLMNAGGPAQMYDFQRFLAARDERDAAKIGASWSLFLVVRWAMVMGITLLALTGILGVTDSERVMPLVLKDFLPVGLRGIVLAGLLAAFMSTFSSTVNSGAAFIVRDIWQPYFKPRATERQSVRFSYWATILLVALGVIIGFQGKSIAEIWNWMMIALGGGVIVPNVLRWYWWRMNGWGYAWGTLGGMALSLLVLFLGDDVPQFYVFPLIVGASLIMSVLGSLLTSPVEFDVLAEFVRRVRPFGMWGHVKDRLDPLRKAKSEGTGVILINVLLGMVGIFCLYLFPMYLVGHWYGRSLICLGVVAAVVVVLKFTWYRNLPPGKR